MRTDLTPGHKHLTTLLSMFLCVAFWIGDGVGFGLLVMLKKNPTPL